MSTPIEQIKAKLDIVELIQSHLKLEKAGSNFKGRCPFHQEKTPSFFVSPARQMWHCFGCQKGGDHFQFIQELENVEFADALRILAERTGIELKKEDPQARSERNRFYNLLEEAVLFYESNLARRTDVRDYLRERGLKDEVVKQFRIGYAEPKWEALLEHLISKGFKNDEVEKTGLVIKKESGESRYYDRFRARVMFPLSDSSGRVVGFTGRIFAKDGENQKDADAKYINTPQTPFYDKSKLLYGFDRAKSEIRRKNYAVLVEGQMDVCMSHQAGVTNAVAVSGTALTGSHLVSLRRLADQLRFSFDMDRAGLLAARKGIDLAIREGFDVKAVILPDGEDPADVIKREPEEWKRAVSSARPFIEFYLDIIRSKIKDEREFRNKVIKHVLPYVADLASDVERAHWIKEMAGRLLLSEEPLWNDLNRIISARKNSKKEDRPDPGADNSKTRKDLIEERILGLLVSTGKDNLPSIADCRGDWFSPARRAMFNIIGAGSAIDDHYIKKLALASELAYADAENIDLEMKQLLKNLKKEFLREKLEETSLKIRQAEREGSNDALIVSLDEFKRFSEELNREQ